jgi:16S rRNA (cytosine967-C5)-methyltransferase
MVDDGLASYQDIGSGLVVAALDVKRGDRILDACAGRGGKTATIFATVGAEIDLTACDRKGSKLERLEFELSREGFRARTHVVDFTVDSPPGAFDRVLIDAPCSGTGTMGRRPEIRWRLQPESVGALCSLQRKMLSQGARLIKPGGRLVFAVCSVFLEESAGHLDEFLISHPDFEKVLNPPSIWPDSVPWNDGVPFIDPGVTSTDGYGILCLRRKEG